MPNREEKRNLETIPVGSLGIIALKSCQPLGEKIDKYLVKWRGEREASTRKALPFPVISVLPILSKPTYPVLVPAKPRVPF